MQVLSNAILFGTGHRPSKIGAQQDWVRSQIRERLLRLKPSMILCGMAQGFDQWLALECIQLGIPFTAVVPFVGQDSRWPTSARLEYRRILQRAQGAIMLQTEPPKDDRQAAAWMQDRNVWMVDHAVGGIACYAGDPTGGTANCVRYARARNKPLDVIDPYGAPR